MKLLVIGDLHGQMPNVYYQNFDAILAPGDFCSSDKVAPLVFQYMKIRFKKKSSINKWYEIIGKREAKKLVLESLEKGRNVLEYLNSFNVPVYIVPGNWEWTGKQNKEKGWEFLEKGHYYDLIKGFKNIRDTHHKILDMGECQIVGHGISAEPEYPQYKEDLERIPLNELKEMKKYYESSLEEISTLFDNAKKPIIFLTHDVPFNTSIDEITNKESPKYGYHYGSLVARNIIDKYHPLLSIGGHMHEHFDKTRIGKTICINAGYGGGVNTLIEIENGKIRSIEMKKDKKQ